MIVTNYNLAYYTWQHKLTGYLLTYLPNRTSLV